MYVIDRIEEHMSEYPCIANAGASVAEAAEFMQKCGFRHLPVLDKGKLVGVISDRDLRQAVMLNDSMEVLVSDVMSRNPYSVKVGTPLSIVAEMMAEHKYGCTVILNQQDEVVGIFTTTDGMRLLSKALSSGRWPEFRTMAIEDAFKSGFVI